MIGRFVRAFFGLLLAVFFGGVGVLGLWAIGATVMEGVSARDWVRVRADVVKYDHEGVRYRYDWDGKEHFGTNFGIGLMRPAEADEETDGRLSTALAEKRPITVFVNPADPSRSATGTAIEWAMLAMLLPFALVFGGVGVGGLWTMVGAFRGSTAQDEAGKALVAIAALFLVVQVGGASLAVV